MNVKTSNFGRPGKPRIVDHEQVVKMRLAGLTAAKTAELCGCTPRWVQIICADYMATQAPSQDQGAA